MTILTVASSWEAAGAASLGYTTSLSSGSLVHFFSLAVTLKNDSSVRFGGIFKATRLNHKQNAKCAVHIFDDRRSVDFRHA